MTSRTGFVWHERYAWHDTGHAALSASPDEWIEPEEHVESPESKRRLRNLLDVSGVLDQLVAVAPRPATVAELTRFHTPDYVSRIADMSEGVGGDAGALAPFGHGGFEIARLAAGGLIELVDAVLEGRVDNGYALVRPPGHHAEAGLGMGFCLFNNVVVAVMHAHEARSVGRIAIVDWDVHHGNGTQHAFAADPTTLFISLHQAGLFPPGSGGMDERGEGAGLGATINLPLPPGSGRGAYLAAFDRVVIPALERFEPELIVVSSGFDSGGYDPLGRMMLSGRAYRAMTRRLLDLAARLGNAHVVMAHEGGYSTSHVPLCGIQVIEELSGASSGMPDRFDANLEALPYQDLQPHQETVIAAAEPLVEDLPGVVCRP